MKFFLKWALVLSFTFTGIFGCKKEEVNLPPTVNAGSDRSVIIEQNQKDTIVLSATATDPDGQILGYTWTQISGPNTAFIENSGSALTNVSGVVSGTYVFQLMAVDNSGNTGVETVTITVELKAPTIMTLTLQPHNNSEEAIIYGNNSGIDLSNNMWTENCAGSWTTGGSPINLRSVFKFDFSSIPANTTIVSAKLTLYTNPTPENGDLVHANSGTDNGFYIQRITSSWTGATLTYSNQPTATTENQVSIPATSQTFLDVTDIDVTQLVQLMIQPNANKGFLIRLQNEVYYNIRNFCSSKYPDASKHPKLIIEYVQ